MLLSQLEHNSTDDICVIRALDPSHMNGIEDEEKELEIENDRFEDELNETVMMSQHVYDDVDKVERGHEEGNRDGEQENGNEKEGNVDEEDLLKQDSEDSWTASMIGNIPQLDGTFDIEDLMNKKTKHSGSMMKQPPGENSLASRPVTRTGTYTHPELGNLPNVVVTCKCPRINEIKSSKKDPRRFRIPQLDGSSDNDFWESDDFPRKSRKGSKTPLKTYAKSAQKKKQTLRRRRKDSFTEREDLRKFRIDLLMGGHSSKSSDFSCVAESSSSISSSSSEDNSPGDKVDFTKSEDVLKASQGRKGDSFSFPCEANSSKPATRRARTNILTKPRDTGVNSSGSPGQKSSRGIVLSPKCFYSSSKRVSSQISSSPRRTRAKRKSLGTLEFTETSNSSKWGSRNNKVRDIEETSTIVNIPHDDKGDNTPFSIKSQKTKLRSQGTSTSTKHSPAESPHNASYDDHDQDTRFSMKSRRTKYGSQSTSTNRKHSPEDLEMKGTEILKPVTEPLSITRSRQSRKMSLSCRKKSELKQKSKKSVTEPFATPREEHTRKAPLLSLTHSEFQHSSSSGAEQFGNAGLLDDGASLEAAQMEKLRFDTGSDKGFEKTVEAEHGSILLSSDAEFQRQIKRRAGRKGRRGTSVFDTESEEGSEETMKDKKGSILLRSDTEFQIQVGEKPGLEGARETSAFDTENDGCLEEPLGAERGSTVTDSNEHFRSQLEGKKGLKAQVGTLSRGLTYPFTRDCYVHLTDLKLHDLKLSQDTRTVITEQDIPNAELMTGETLTTGATGLLGKGPKKRKRSLILSKSAKKARFEHSDPDVISTLCNSSKRFQSGERLEKELENSDPEVKPTRSGLAMRRESGVTLGKEKSSALAMQLESGVTFGKEKSSALAMRRESGVTLGKEKSCDENTCDSCCDFLFKSSHPSPDSSVTGETYSPPRPFTPKKTKSRLELRKRPDRRCIGGVTIRFQNDSNCTLIKPVRLEFKGDDFARNETMGDQSHECQEPRPNLRDRLLDFQDLNRAVEERKKKTNCDTDTQVTEEGHCHVDKLKCKTRVASLKTLDADLQFSPIINEVKSKDHRSKSSRLTSGETKAFVSSQISQDSSLSDRFDAPSIGDSTQAQTNTQIVGSSDAEAKTKGVDYLSAEDSGSGAINVGYKSSGSSAHSNIDTALILAEKEDLQAAPGNDMKRSLSVFDSLGESCISDSQSELPGKKIDGFTSHVEHLNPGVKDNERVVLHTSASEVKTSEIVSDNASKCYDANTTCIVTFDPDTPVMEITPEEMQDLDILVEDSLHVDSLEVAMSEDEIEKEDGFVSAKPKNVVISEETVSRKASEPERIDSIIDQPIVLFEDPEKTIETIKSSIEEKSEEMPTERLGTDLRTPDEMVFSNDNDDRRQFSALVMDLEKTKFSCGKIMDLNSNAKAEGNEICTKSMDGENSTRSSIDLKLSDFSPENQEQRIKTDVQGKYEKLDAGKKNKPTATKLNKQSPKGLDIARMDRVDIDNSEVSLQNNDENTASDRSDIRGASPIPCSLESNFSDSTLAAVETKDIQDQDKRVTKSIASIKDESMLVMPTKKPPSRNRIVVTARDYGLGETRNKKAYFSDPKDVPAQTRYIGDKRLRIRSTKIRELPHAASNSGFQGSLERLQKEEIMNTTLYQDLHHQAAALNVADADIQKMLIPDNNILLMPCKKPPTQLSIRTWLEKRHKKGRVQKAPKNQELKSSGKDLKSEDHGLAGLKSPPFASPTNTQRGPIPTSLKDVSRTGKRERSIIRSPSPEQHSFTRVRSPTLGSPVFTEEQSHVTQLKELTAKGEQYKRSPSLSSQQSTQQTTSSSKLKKVSEPGNKDLSDIKSPTLGSPSCTPRRNLRLRIPKPFSSNFVGSPPFSPKDSISACKDEFTSMKSPVSSTPMTLKKKASFKLPLTTAAASKPKSNTSTPATPKLKRTITDSSQIDGPTPTNNFGFGFTQVNYDDAKNAHEIQHLTILSIELHMQTRRDLCPDPNFDPICAIFYHLISDTDDSKETGIFIVDANQSNHKEVSTKISRPTPEAVEKLIKSPAAETSPSKSAETQSKTQKSQNDSAQSTSAAPSTLSNPSHRTLLHKSGVTDYEQRCYDDERSMILAFQAFVKSRDPDMIVGYEIQMLSWGYLIDRAKELDINLCPLISRIPGVDKVSRVNDRIEKDVYLYGQSSDVKIAGRVLLNVWRIMRSEVTLRLYSFENVAFHVLHERLPKYSHRTLSAWWGHQTSLHRWRVVDYYIRRCRANISMLVRTDFISRTSELARIFGILFYSVISRGSQFRVESMMLRIAKPMNYIPVSPDIKQRAQMAAPEVIPLVMEPESRFYPDPVIVLDFQSLYPSIIIAYNYCFSTCLGNVKHWNEPGAFKFGTTSLGLPLSLLQKLQNDIHVSPNGVGFVKPNVRKGILPKMLDDILKTRIMVKASMKKNKDNKALHRMLDARQLGLKLIANVTYGYTSANFSGRMPCVEIADSVVRKGREALETTINLINSTKRWNAKVVYGDTDSVFIQMKGATKQRAFDVANEIVEAVTKINPQPMKLKFEKVYMPCILQTKKRYIGYMYESIDQKEPVFDAKGIETVRRDSCAAVSKILERSLKLLFEERDLSLVKKYVQRQFTKIMEGRVSIQDFTFAKEYRGIKNYRPGACVPALSIARRLLATDKRAEPRSGERVPYVIVYGTPGLPLIQLVRRPIEMFQDSTLRLNGSYYITKQIGPSLNRAFSLIGVDVLSWYNELPRPQRKIIQCEPTAGKKRKGTISQYFSSIHCPICGELTRSNLCSNCQSDPQQAVTILSDRIMTHERKFGRLTELCYHCTGSRDQPLKCISHDCPVIHKLYHVKMDLGSAYSYRNILEELQ
eukprot:Seg958.6 transcript_id=Seg958.6/GoldUCD/mRNA.D3Y31 product="DNA polymerase zeta catalytic subunit" protein_id=Seg958.6/GoldUCD/D3Y31